MKRVDDVATVRAEHFSTRFHVPRIEKLLVARFARVVVLHLNLHDAGVVHVLSVPVHTEIDSKTLR